jgi:hypothetical protein
MALGMASPLLAFDHGIKLRLHLVAKVFLHGIHVGEFGKGPAAVLLGVIHAGL